MTARLLLLALLALTGCAAQARQPDAAPPAAPQPAAVAMPDLFRRYQSDESYVSRFYRVPWSQVRMDRLGRFYDEWLAQLEATDYEPLGPSDRIDWHLLRTNVQWQQSDLSLQRARAGEMAPLMPFAAELQNLEQARRRMELADPQQSATLLDTVAEQVKAIRKRVEDGRKDEDKRSEDALTVSPVVAQRGAGALDELAEMLERWGEHHEEFIPEFAWWTRRPRESVQKELRDLAKYLREEVAGLKGKDEDPLVGDPIGREAILADIKGEMLAYSPEELIAIGERELAWCEEQMKLAAAQVGFPDDWRTALAKVKDAHVPPGQQAAFVRDEGRAAIKFLKDRDLLTIPPLCEEAWRLEMHSVETQRTLPFAVYGGQYMGVSYAAESHGHADKLMAMRGNNRHFTHIVTPHELIPGHHLQGFFADRERQYRRIFSTPFLVEGWALYWEFRLWELGWAGATGQDEAMDRIGMLFWRMHRAARIIVSLRFHLGTMTPAEMIEFLVERVGHERSGATAEVRRYIGGGYSPLYQCAYMLGGIQLRALHRELVENGRMSDKEFNDAVMRENSMPIELIRAALKGESLPRDWTPAWRIAEP
jgi:uncharacterized protein (DUF885 family)